MKISCLLFPAALVVRVLDCPPQPRVMGPGPQNQCPQEGQPGGGLGLGPRVRRGCASPRGADAGGCSAVFAKRAGELGGLVTWEPSQPLGCVSPSPCGAGLGATAHRVLTGKSQSEGHTAPPRFSRGFCTSAVLPGSSRSLFRPSSSEAVPGEIHLPSPCICLALLVVLTAHLQPQEGGCVCPPVLGLPLLPAGPCLSRGLARAGAVSPERERELGR